MNKKYVLSSLNKIANELDNNSLFDEANEITEIMHKLVTSQYTGPGSTMEYQTAVKPGAGLVPEMGYKSKRDKQYRDMINYAKNFLYDPKVNLMSDKKIRTMNDWVLDRLDTLTPAQQKKFTEQWDRIKKNYLDSVDKKPKVENVTLKPPTGTDIVMDMIDQFSPRRMFRLNDLPKVDVIVDESNSNNTDEEKRAKLATYLNRWVNKAENIYKAWSSKPGTARSTRDTIGLVGDILDYMQAMEDQINSAFKSMVAAKKSTVSKILSDLASGSSMPSPAMPTPYSKMTGYQSKKPSEFGTGERLTGKELREQARKETREF